jgi:lipopolysaccharide exporter
MNLKQQALSGVRWSGLSMGGGTALQFITLAVLARLLTPSDFGLMGMVMVVIGFARAFVDMGISNAIIHRQDATKDQLASLYWLNILAGIAIFGLVCASVPLIVRFYHEPRLPDLLYLSAVICLITPFGQQFEVIFQKELKFNQLAEIEIATVIVNSMVAIVLAYLGFGVFSLIWGQLAGNSGKVIMLVSAGWRDWRPGFHFAKRDLRGYLSFGLYQMGERAINYLNTNLDYILIGSMLGAQSLGYYTLAYSLIIKPSAMINPVITKVAFPVFSRIHNEPDRLKKGYLKVLQLLSTVNFPIMAGLAAVASVAVPVIFGKQWLPSIILIQILAFVGLLRSHGNPIDSLLLSKGRADLGFKWNLALTIFLIPGLYLGAKMGGTVGVASAFLLLMAIFSVFNYLILIRKLLGPCLHEYIHSMWPSLWMSGVMMVAVFAVGSLPYTASQPIILIIQVLCGVTIYLGLMIWNQKMFLDEIKNMVLNREVVVDKY